MSNGKLLKLKCNSAGHYTIPVCEWTNENCNVVLHLEHLQQLSKEEKEIKAKKDSSAIRTCLKRKIGSVIEKWWLQG